MATKPGRKPNNSVEALHAPEQIQFYGRKGVIFGDNIAADNLRRTFLEFVALDEDRFDAMLVEWIKSERV